MPKKMDIPAGFEGAAARYNNGELSVADLATELGVAKSTALKWMHQRGVKMNPPGLMISKKLKGRASSQRGAKRSDETRARIRAAKVGSKPTTVGFKFSDESKLKMRQAALKRVATTDSLQKMRAGLEKKRMPAAERIAREKARAACKRMLRRILTMARTRKDGRRSESILGYTKQELRLHIESQFRDGMGWDVRDSFHIDHIKPVAQFFREGCFDPTVINALSNLQVLTPEENRAKSDNFTPDRRQKLVIDHAGTRPWSE